MRSTPFFFFCYKAVHWRNTRRRLDERRFQIRPQSSQVHQLSNKPRVSGASDLRVYEHLLINFIEISRTCTSGAGSWRILLCSGRRRRTRRCSRAECSPRNSCRRYRRKVTKYVSVAMWGSWFTPAKGQTTRKQQKQNKSARRTGTWPVCTSTSSLYFAHCLTLLLEIRYSLVANKNTALPNYRTSKCSECVTATDKK